MVVVVVVVVVVVDVLVVVDVVLVVVLDAEVVLDVEVLVEVVFGSIELVVFAPVALDPVVVVLVVVVLIVVVDPALVVDSASGGGIEAAPDDTLGVAMIPTTQPARMAIALRTGACRHGMLFQGLRTAVITSHLSLSTSWAALRFSVCLLSSDAARPRSRTTGAS